MLRALGMAGLAAAAVLTSGAAQAQGRYAAGAVMETPANCQWLDEARLDQRLWCRSEGGRMRPTETLRRNMDDVAASCPRGTIDDGLGCVDERRALAALKANEPVMLDYQPAPWTPVSWPRRESQVEAVMSSGRAGFYDNGAPRDVVVLHRIRP